MSAIDLIEILRRVVTSPYSEFYLFKVVQVYSAPLFFDFQHKLERRRLESAKCAKEITEREHHHLETVLEICSLMSKLRSAAQKSPQASQSALQIVQVVKDLKAVLEIYQKGFINQDETLEIQINKIKDSIDLNLRAIVLSTPHEYHMRNRILSHIDIMIEDLIKAEKLELSKLTSEIRIVPISKEIVGFYLLMTKETMGLELVSEITNKFGSSAVCKKLDYDEIKSKIEKLNLKNTDCLKIIKSFFELMTLYCEHNKKCTITKIPNHSELLMEFLTSLYEQFLQQNECIDSTSKEEAYNVVNNMISNLETNNESIKDIIRTGCQVCIENIYLMYLEKVKILDVRKSKSINYFEQNSEMKVKKTAIRYNDENSDIDSIKSGIVRMVSDDVKIESVIPKTNSSDENV